MRAVGVVVTGIVFIWHAHETVSWCPPAIWEQTKLPFTVNDHPLHYYYSQLTADFFSRRHAFWGYDPFFMAGYAKSMIFPTGCTMPELVAVVFGRDSVSAFRLWVASCLFLPPILLGLAARSLTRSWGAFGLSFCTGVVWVWCGWPVTYVHWGMAPFILAVTASVCSGTVLARWLDQPSYPRLVMGGCLATLSTIAHPCSPVILLLMLFPAYLVKARAMRWREHCLAWSVPLVVIICWSPWWLPALVLRETLGTTETGFVNEKIGARLLELVQAIYPEETALLVAAAGMLVALRGIGRAAFCAVVLGSAQLFVLTYFGSAVPWIWKLQPGRYTQPFYAALIILIAVGWWRLIGELTQRPWRVKHWGKLALVTVSSALAVLLVVPKVVGYLNYSPHPPLSAELPSNVLELIEDLRERVNSSGRVLFEDRALAYLGDRDPFPGVNPSALLPLLAPGQYIGGPYLRTHLKTNFTQVGDGYFFGRDPYNTRVDRNTFQRYAKLYNIRWAVLWSAPLTRLADQNSEFFRQQGRFGYLRVYELDRRPNWAVVGSADVRAQPDRLEVTAVRPGVDGVLVLSYHWIPTLRSSVLIRPLRMEDDPVPFIALDNPPEQFVIENRLW
ncbi:MAG: hypothetical protein HY000_26380 [Planctomycetes bacterium]|nr:hypothetical protein [Planctomycetota bacterium]